MSSPNAFASFTIFKGDIITTDFMHIVRESDGSVLGWIDENGYPQGTLAVAGGGGSVYVQGSLVTNPNFLPGSGIGFSVAGSNVTIANTGVTSFNGLTGATGITSTGGSVSIIQSGNFFDLEVSGSGAGVLSLNSLIGNVNITSAGAGIGILTSGQNIEIQNTGVTSLATSGSGLAITPGSTGALVISNTGVTGITAGPGISTSATTGGVIVSNTQPTPWADIQNYGGIPKPAYLQGATTTFNSVGTTANITVASALPYFVNGAGVCLGPAGNATTQSTPSAPTVTSPVINGSQTVTYKIVGVDAKCGLTAASPAATVSAPAVFSPKPAVISSITASAGVVTVLFATPLNPTVTSGMTLHITGVTGGGSAWNGIWPIATAPSTIEVTIAIAGASGAGTVTGATGRVSNTALISSISRNSSGVITVTTLQNHNYKVGTTAQPTVVILEGINYPADLNGHFVIASTPTANTFTCNTGNTFVATGILNTNGNASSSGSYSAASATVWEYTQVACPALSGTTTQYYIYSDNASPGGSLNLIGKTLYGESHFIDWGLNYGGGFKAPAYVPLTPPSSSQNQLFSTTIVSGGGTGNMVLAANVPSTLVGGTISYDDGPCLLAACNALPSSGGQVQLSPPQIVGSIAQPTYIFNSPISLPPFREMVISSSLFINETLYLGEYTSLIGSRASNYIQGNVGGTLANPPIYGLACPMIQFGLLSNAVTAGLNVSSLNIDCTYASINGQYGLSTFGGNYIKIIDSNFISTTSIVGNNVPLIFNGNSYSVEMRNITYGGYGAYGSGQLVGQSCWGPCVGNIVIRASDNPIENNFPPYKFSLSGVNNSNGRGIMIDCQYGFESITSDFEFSQIWDQAPTTPSIMFSGAPATWDVIMRAITNDSENIACVANWNGQLNNLSIGNCETTPLITGNFINGLNTYGYETPTVGQTIYTSVSYYGAANIGSVVTAPPKVVISSNTIPQSLGQSGMIFAPLAPNAVSAIASGTGSIPAGTYPVVVTFVGWDGGESDPNPNVLLGQNPINVTVNGSQGIQISWTPRSGTQGAYLYINGFRNSTLYTTSPQTFTAIPTNHSQPLYGATGTLIINPNMIVAPELILPTGSNKLTLAGPTLTGNRTVTFADGSQSTVVAASLTTTSGGSPYTVTLQGATSSSHVSITPTNALAAADLAAGQVYVSSKGTNQIVIATGATAAETFDVMASIV